MVWGHLRGKQLGNTATKDNLQGAVKGKIAGRSRLHLERPACQAGPRLASASAPAVPWLIKVAHCLDCLCKQCGLGWTPASLLGVWNVGMCWAEGAYGTSPHWKPQMLNSMGFPGHHTQAAAFSLLGGECAPWSLLGWRECREPAWAPPSSPASSSWSSGASLIRHSRKSQPGVTGVLVKLWMWRWPWGPWHMHNKQLGCVLSTLTYRIAVLQHKLSIF